MSDAVQSRSTDLAGLRQALARLEDANDKLAGLRTPEQYLAMLDLGQEFALADLQDARNEAKRVLAAAQGSQEPVGWQAREKARGPEWFWTHCEIPHLNPEYEYRPVYAAPHGNAQAGREVSDERALDLARRILDGQFTTEDAAVEIMMYATDCIEQEKGHLDPAYEEKEPEAYRETVRRVGAAREQRMAELRDCLQSIADMPTDEPREPDDADWRFRCLSAVEAAKNTLAVPSTHDGSAAK